MGGGSAFVHGTRVATPNDPKLSDRRGWRDRCAAGGKAAAEARAVTAGAVRCSAWLGVAGLVVEFVTIKDGKVDSDAKVM